MRLFIISCLLFASALAQTDHPSFQEFLKTYKKEYKGSELIKREQIYGQNIKKIVAHNKGEHGKQFRMGVNKFADWTPEELSSLFGMDRRMLRRRVRRAGFDQVFNVEIPEKVPDSWDWTTKGILTPVKDQESCGSCWAFAGTEAIEAALTMDTGVLATLSPQAFVDCVPNPNDCGGTGGCQGATPDLLFSYAMDQTDGWGGIVLESDYPYKAATDQCRDGMMKSYATLGGWVDVPSNNYTALMAAVLKQPVTVGVAAMSWSFYEGGVLSTSTCDAEIDHAVLLVGYGTDARYGDYWKIQNSWGAGWGEKGFIRIQRSPDYCVTDKNTHDGFACDGDPDEARVCGTCGIQYGASYPIDVQLAKPI